MTVLLKIKANQSAALSGTAYCLTILTGVQHFPKFERISWSKTEMVSDTNSLQDSHYKRYIKKNEGHKWREKITFCDAHNESIPHRSVLEMCYCTAFLVNVSNICE